MSGSFEPMLVHSLQCGSHICMQPHADISHAMKCTYMQQCHTMCCPCPMHSVWEEHVRKEQRIIKLGTEFHLSDARKRKQGHSLLYGETKWGAPGESRGRRSREEVDGWCGET